MLYRSDKILSIINKIQSNEWVLLQIGDVFEKPWPGLGDPRSTDKLTGFHRNFTNFTFTTEILDVSR